jgi:hypothetical protein
MFIFIDILFFLFDIIIYKMNNINIDMSGVTPGDSLIWDDKNQVFTQVKIPFTDHNNKNLPNFIISLSGQSNSQGLNSSYDPNNSADQPDKRIFGWNPVLGQWQIADLNTDSLGFNYLFFKQNGRQCLAFHFAKRLIQSNPNIRPGIINLGMSGATIAFWAKWKNGDKWYSVSQQKVASYEGSPCFLDGHTRNIGYLYDCHLFAINAALQKLNPPNRFVNVICWHQGEQDPEPDGYLYDSLSLVINQYYNDLKKMGYLDPTRFGFIAGSTTGSYALSTPNASKVNQELDILNHDSMPYTKEVDASDLERNAYGPDGVTPDLLHFTAESQRLLGRRYFNAYRSMFFNYY